MKPNSTPPRTLSTLRRQKSSGSVPFEMPRYTLHARVILPSLTMDELITCSVVVYWLPRQSSALVLTM